MRRALKVLADREVSPQLGLLKSTLLQLDSTFSERTYGAGSFRDFAQKLAAAGHVTLRESGRNVLVELSRERAGARSAQARDRATSEPATRARAEAPPRAAATVRRAPRPRRRRRPRVADGIREVRRLFQTAQKPPRWPMYIRQLKQFLRNVDATFDERKFGFASLGDLMRACQRDGLFRIERDRQGVMRIFPGNITPGGAGAGRVAVRRGGRRHGGGRGGRGSRRGCRGLRRRSKPAGDSRDRRWQRPAGARDSRAIVDAEEARRPPAGEAGAAAAAAPARRAPPGPPAKPRAQKAADAGAGAAPRPRKSPAKPRAPRGRQRTDASTE